MDRAWKYVPANSTDISKTFARIRRQQKEAAPPPPVPANVKSIKSVKGAGK